VSHAHRAQLPGVSEHLSDIRSPFWASVSTWVAHGPYSGTRNQQTRTIWAMQHRKMTRTHYAQGNIIIIKYVDILFMIYNVLLEDYDMSSTIQNCKLWRSSGVPGASQDNAFTVANAVHAAILYINK
jgi:hypothetical protein